MRRQSRARFEAALGLVLLGAIAAPHSARADDPGAPPILLVQAPPPGYYPPPPPPPGYYPPPPPPPGYYRPSPRPYYAPPPPQPAYSWAYFDLGLTLGVPVLLSSDIDGNGDSGAAIGGGVGVHAALGLKVNYLLGFGADLSYGGYRLSNGIAEGLGHADVGMVARGFRGGLGLAMMGDDVGLDAYVGHYWRLGGPWCAGVSGEAMWDSVTSDVYLTLNFEVGLEFGNR